MFQVGDKVKVNCTKDTDITKALKGCVLRIDAIADNVATVTVTNNRKISGGAKYYTLSTQTRVKVSDGYQWGAKWVPKEEWKPVARYSIPCKPNPCKQFKKNELVGFTFKIRVASLELVEKARDKGRIITITPQPIEQPEITSWNGEERRKPIDTLKARAQYAATTGCHVVITGSWVWATFDRCPDRSKLDKLKKNGFRWAKRKRKWYYAGKPASNKRPVSWSKIVHNYGIEQVTEEETT